jgi:hypothetical protein
MLQIVASLIDAARGVIYDCHMFIVQATGFTAYERKKKIIRQNNLKTKKQLHKYMHYFDLWRQTTANKWFFYFNLELISRK